MRTKEALLTTVSTSRVARPLETICDYYKQDEDEFVKGILKAIGEIASQKINNYGYADEKEGTNI